MVQTRDEERAEYLAKATLELLDAGRPEVGFSFFLTDIASTSVQFL